MQSTRVPQRSAGSGAIPADLQQLLRCQAGLHRARQGLQRAVDRLTAAHHQRTRDILGVVAQVIRCIRHKGSEGAPQADEIRLLECRSDGNKAQPHGSVGVQRRSKCRRSVTFPCIKTHDILKQHMKGIRIDTEDGRSVALLLCVVDYFGLAASGGVPVRVVWGDDVARGGEQVALFVLCEWV